MRCRALSVPHRGAQGAAAGAGPPEAPEGPAGLAGLHLGRGRSSGRTPPGRAAGAARGAEWPTSPRRWRGKCGDAAHAPRVPALRPASLGEHGAPRTRADPAELAGGEPQPTGAWHSPVHQVRVSQRPGGAGDLARNGFGAAGGAPEEGKLAADCTGRLQMRTGGAAGFLRRHRPCQALWGRAWVLARGSVHSAPRSALPRLCDS